MNAVYAGASKVCERYEHQGKLTGNGHHMAQEIVTVVERLMVVKSENPLLMIKALCAAIVPDAHFDVIERQMVVVGRTGLEALLIAVFLVSVTSRHMHNAPPELITEIVAAVLSELRDRGYVAPLEGR